MSCPIRTDQKITIVGMTGTGKTTLAKEISKVIKRKVVICPYDVYDQWKGYGKVIPTDPASFEEVAEPLYQKGNIFIIIDEADTFFPNYGKLDPESLRYKLIHMGRPRNIGVAFISRRPASLHTDPRSQSTHFFFFRLILPNDIMWAYQVIGNYAYELKNLKDYWFYHYDGRNIYLHPPIRISKIKAT